MVECGIQATTRNARQYISDWMRLMLKTRFMEYCRRHNEAICSMHIRIGRFNREIFPTVELYGTWGRYDDDGEWLGFIGSVTLFTPQHKVVDFRHWNDLCEARAVKFRKWLEEWYQENPSTRNTK